MTQTNSDLPSQYEIVPTFLFLLRAMLNIRRIPKVV